VRSCVDDDFAGKLSDTNVQAQIEAADSGMETDSDMEIDDY
jgi:hypothetical protein